MTSKAFPKEAAMAIAVAKENLYPTFNSPEASGRQNGWFLRFLLEVETWLDNRASLRALNRMDDRALSDIGLSQADVERITAARSWERFLLGHK
jgi:uncharacterized protein YjiS (DUF1127 family)